MGVITKTVGNRQYAYLAIREGKKVRHKYLGPVESELVKQRIAEQLETTGVPERFRPLFWDTDLANIRIREHARYIIERVLELGDLEAVNWVQKVYTVQAILDVLMTSRSLSDRSRNFWELWFGGPDA